MAHSGAQEPELEVPFVIMTLVKCCFKRPCDLSPGGGLILKCQQEPFSGESQDCLANEGLRS